MKKRESDRVVRVSLPFSGKVGNLRVMANSPNLWPTCTPAANTHSRANSSDKSRRRSEELADMSGSLLNSRDERVMRKSSTSVDASLSLSNHAGLHLNGTNSLPLCTFTRRGEKHSQAAYWSAPLAVHRATWEEQMNGGERAVGWHGMWRCTWRVGQHPSKVIECTSEPQT